MRYEIDGLPDGDLLPGEYAMRFSGYAEHPEGGEPVLRFAFIAGPAAQEQPQGTTWPIMEFSEARTIDAKRLARVIAQLIRAKVIKAKQIGLKLDNDRSWNDQIEDWLTS